MAIQPLEDMIGRDGEWKMLVEFSSSGEPVASLGLVWGRRRIGKSFILQDLTERTGGFYYHAVRGSSAEALRELGVELGRFQGSVAPLSFPSWADAVQALLGLGREREILVVLDEFPYLLEHTPGLESLLQRAFGPRANTRQDTQTRLVLCGSAISVMGDLLTGSAPLRGRAGLDLRMHPFDFRIARQLHGIDDLRLAIELYAVIGGVAAYAREMVEHDLPKDPEDFERWICRRVLSPAAPLFGEVDFLLGEDPVVSKVRKPNLYHATLAGVALGNHAWSSLTRYVKIPGTSLNAIVSALVASDFIAQVGDPVRDNRPIYQPSDPLVRFHYAIIRRHQVRLGRHGVETHAIWRGLSSTFRSQVLGPCFESMARFWTVHFAAQETLGGMPDYVGPTTLTMKNGDVEKTREVDVVVAADDGATPAERTVLAVGEAKAGEHITNHHLARLEAVRKALGDRASEAKLLLFGPSFDDTLQIEASRRSDLELIDFERLYGGN